MAKFAQLPKFKINKPFLYDFSTVYADSKFDANKLSMHMEHEENPFDLEYSMVQIKPDALSSSWLKEPFTHSFNSLFSSINLTEESEANKPFAFLPTQERMKTLAALPVPIRPLWFLLCVLLSDSNLFPLTKDFKFVEAKNAVFYCLLEKHYLKPEPCGCMSKAGIDFLFHWEAKNRHFEVCPDLNDKRIKFLRQHKYFVWRTPFPGSEELTMALQLNPPNHIFKWNEVFVHHGAPGLRFFESRSYRLVNPSESFWYVDSKK